MTYKLKPLSLQTTIVWLILFSVAMAFLESLIVVYFRDIYYPNGFGFPLKPMKSSIALVEFWREVATIVMLLSIGIMSGKYAAQRFAFFLLAFAIWDIFYYIFLYVLLAWPSSLFTWDLLFLVPFPWVGPVISPIIISMFMIIMASFIIRFKTNFNLIEWGFSITGSLIVILSWVLDYLKYSASHASSNVWTITSDKDLFNTSNHYIPIEFNWYIFLIGVVLIFLSILFYFLRNKKSLHV